MHINACNTRILIGGLTIPGAEISKKLSKITIVKVLKNVLDDLSTLVRRTLGVSLKIRVENLS